MFRVTYWTRTWVAFQKEEGQLIIRSACSLMETLTMEIFVRHRWWSSNRLNYY
jgi:hypothetical protein